MVEMLTVIWLYILPIWKTQNQHLHQKATQLNLPNYRQAATSLYEQQHQLPPEAQEALYSQPLKTILELPEPQLHRWVQKGHQYFNQQLKAVKKWATLLIKDIWSFLWSSAQSDNDLQPP